MKRWLNSQALARSYTRNPWLWVGLVAASLVPSLMLAFSLSVRSDFKELLPQTKPSVVSLNRLLERVGGVSSLIVGIEGDDPKAIQRFIDDLVPRLQALGPDYIRYVEHNIRDTKAFFERNKYLYIDLGDLREIHQRLAKKIRYEKLKRNPFFIALEEDKVEFDVSDLERKYEGKTSRYDKYLDGYFFSEDRKTAAVVIRPKGASTSTGFTKDLLGKVEAIVEELDPASYHPSLTYGYTGKFRDTLTEYNQLIRDVLETLALCLGLVALSLWLYFFRLRSIWLLTAAVSIGAAWTFALTKLQIGYLNTQTAFLGSIIVGNGVNYGIILLARFMEERRGGRELMEAIGRAIETTWLGTLTAATTTSVAFAALGFSEVKGFSQFGFIGGVGMTLCWVATYVALPPLLVISERIVPIVKGRRLISKQWEFLLEPVGALVSYSPRLVGAFGIALFLGCLGLTIRFIPRSLEYDFTKLRNRPKVQAEIEAFKQRIDDIFGQSSSPVVMLLDQEKQAQWVCDAVLEREATLAVGARTIDSCKTLQAYLPTDQSAKLKVLDDVHELLQDNALNFVGPKYRAEIDKFRKEVNVAKVGLTDLPDSIKRNFQELDGTVGRFAYVYPRPDARLNNGERLLQFVGVLENVKLADGTTVRLSGEPAIFADLLRAIRKDGPVATLASFLAVALIVILQFRRKRPITYILVGLVIGVIYMVGLQAIHGTKINFFNFIAYPVTFGIGVDYGVNLFQRYRFEGRGSIRRVLGTVGGAILLCSVTTTIGYATLLWAQSQALASFGWLGLLGELSCLFAAIVVMPAILHAIDRSLPAPAGAVENRRSDDAK